MSDIDWDGKFVNRFFSRLAPLPGKEMAMKKWELCNVKDRPMLKNSEEQTRRLLIEFYEWTEKSTDEIIDQLKREMKVQAFE